MGGRWRRGVKKRRMEHKRAEKRWRMMIKWSRKRRGGRARVRFRGEVRSQATFFLTTRMQYDLCVFTLG